jgi:pimeloyl-ACP methyl ester carboxylesterase
MATLFYFGKDNDDLHGFLPPKFLRANDATVVVLRDSGHWVMEEKPKETMEAVLNFL